MRNQDLIAGRCAVRNHSAFRTPLACPGNPGDPAATQSSPPTDAAVSRQPRLDGLLLGCGDAVIGINPATDSPHAAG
ncbi:ethanolamine ammonia-lyase large subunit domain protein [Mycobacteroides abscessus]|nr:ethanolamine ammonia-lyase subunit EutB [Mycobacteroides abscessus]EUA68273.1 ethanolamine ammonia-lyase large subunit domain protein [Mycobacteroides abscessus]